MRWHLLQASGEWRMYPSMPTKIRGKLGRRNAQKPGIFGVLFVPLPKLQKLVLNLGLAL